MSPQLSFRSTLILLIITAGLLAGVPSSHQVEEATTTTTTTTTTKTTTTTTTTAKPPSTSSLSSSSSLSTIATTTIETGSPTTTTTSGDDSEIVTSTVASPADTLGAINPEDNNSTIIINNPSDDNSTEGSNGGDVAGGIEGKSVASNGNNNFNLADEPPNKNAKIISTVNIDDTTIISGNDDGSLYVDDNTSTMKPASLGKVKSLVNMTQIDQVYEEGTKDEEEVVENWLKMGKRLKKTIGGLIGSMVPMALNMTQEAKISNNCSGAMLKWVLSMNHLKLWAMKMLDASGKPVAGLLEGSMTMFGNYRQCLNIRAPDDDEIEFAGEFREYFRGKYCIIQAKPWLPKKDKFYGLNTKIKSLMEASEDNPWYDKTVFDEVNEWLLAFNYINIRMDLCIPSLCSREDIQSVINYLLRGIDFKARVLRCEMDSISSGYKSSIETSSPDLADALVASAVTSQDNFEHKTIIEAFSQLGWILIPLIATIIVLIATGLTWAIRYQDDIDDDMTELGGSNIKTSIYKPKRFKHTIRSLSLKRSIHSHIKVDYNQLADDKPLALYGIRFILVLWVLMVEFAINFKFEYLRELLPLKDLIFWWPLQVVINSTLQYDSLILLTAFTISYKLCLNDNNVNIAKTLIRYVMDKYIRLMPSIMIMVAFTILLPLLYRGPVWNDLVTEQSAVCQSNGWINMVFLQNFLPYKEICLPHTWLLCVELQLVLLSAPIVYYLNKSYMKSNLNIDNNNNNNKKSLHLHNNLTNESNSNCANNNNNKSSKLFYWLRTTPGVILIGCIIISSFYSFYNVFSKDLPPSYLYTMPDPDSKAFYFGEHFIKIWTHFSVFAIGILAGIECRRIEKNINRGFKKANRNLNNLNNFNKNVFGASGKPYHQQLSSSSTTSLPIISNSMKSYSEQNTDISNVGSTLSININSNSNSQGNVNGNSNNNGIDIENSRNSTGGKYNSAFGGLTATSFGTNSCQQINNSNEHFTNDFEDGKTNSGSEICSKIINSFVTLLALIIMGLIIFSTYDWSLNELPEPIIAGLYDSLSRLLWSLSFVWLLYMVCLPNESSRKFSILSKLLGSPAMVFLGKLSFLIYLIHPLVHSTVLGIQEQPIYSSWLMLFHVLIGNMTITIAIASFVSLFIEMPCRNIFRRCGSTILLKTTTTNSETDSRSSSGAMNETGNSNNTITCASCQSSRRLTNHMA